MFEEMAGLDLPQIASADPILCGTSRLLVNPWQFDQELTLHGEFLNHPWRGRTIKRTSFHHTYLKPQDHLLAA